MQELESLSTFVVMKKIVLWIITFILLPMLTFCFMLLNYDN